MRRHSPSPGENIKLTIDATFYDFAIASVKILS